MKTLYKYLQLFIELLKVNILTRFITSILLVAIFLKISEYHSGFLPVAIAFTIYPIWLSFWLLLFGLVLNPIRDLLPRSWFTKKIIPVLDKFVNKWT
jgi:glycerol uptake facilitator-like aquaporin